MQTQTHEPTHRAVETVARESYGRLVALLAARTRDIAGAEDALADALVAALMSWSRNGIPNNPQTISVVKRCLRTIAVCSSAVRRQVQYS